MIRIEKRQASAFNAILCIKNSIGKDKTREYLTVAYFDKDNQNFVATDGMKLVVYHLPDFLYNLFVAENAKFFTIEKTGTSLLIMPSEKIVEYPNYQRVIPSNDNFPIKGTVSCVRNVTKEKSQFILQSIAILCSAYINTDFAPIIDGERAYNVFANTNKTAIRLDSTDKDLTIVIMPIVRD